jgi:uncharacterized damage-inducible protein DinB
MTLADAALNALRVRVTRVFPMQIRTAAEKLTDEQLWWRPNEKSNSIGNLIIHISGSLDHYLNRGIGGFPYDRDRDGEFAARGTLSKSQLLARMDEMVGRAEKTFDGLTADRLMGPSADPERYTYLIDDLINITTHLSTHTGQILWVAKMLNEGGLDEAWMRTHKRGGAWK